jgi:hypothetical protein
VAHVTRDELIAANSPTYLLSRYRQLMEDINHNKAAASRTKESSGIRRSQISARELVTRDARTKGEFQFRSRNQPFPELDGAVPIVGTADSMDIHDAWFYRSPPQDAKDSLDVYNALFKEVAVLASHSDRFSSSLLLITIFLLRHSVFALDFVRTP